jgi:hypothetical protein
MSDEETKKQKVEESSGESHLIDKLEAAGQIILGEIELIGGALTGDPMTQAEGEFNIETGTIEAEIASDLEEGESTESDSQSDS